STTCTSSNTCGSTSMWTTSTSSTSSPTPMIRTCSATTIPALERKGLALMKALPYIVTLALLVTIQGARVVAIDEQVNDARELNRKLLDKLGTDPDQYEQLVRDLKAFNRLSLSERDRLRRLDRAVQEELSVTQVRLLRAGERYARWLEQLPADDQQGIASEPDPTQRLQRIKELRRRQWLASLPRPTRERLQRAQGAEREALIRQLRSDEQSRRRNWHLAARNWEEISKADMPQRLEDFPAAVRQYVNG